MTCASWTTDTKSSHTQDFEILSAMRSSDKFSVGASTSNDTFISSVTNFKHNKVMIKFRFQKVIFDSNLKEELFLNTFLNVEKTVNENLMSS